MTAEKFDLIIELYRHQKKVMKPYFELLGDGMLDISEAWYQSIEYTATFFGMDEFWYNLCYDIASNGEAFIEIGDTTYVPRNGKDLLYCWNEEKAE